MKLRITGSLMLPIFLVIALIAPLLAADAKLTVVCKKESGEFISNVIVNLVDLKAEPPTATTEKTNKKGEAQFKKAEGVFRVVVKVEGFDPAYQDYVVVGPGEQKVVELVLKPGDFNKKLFFEDAATVQATVNKLFAEGNQLLQQNKFPEAEAKFREALGINRYLTEFRQNLAFALMGQRKWDEAKKELETGLADVATLKLTGKNLQHYEGVEGRLKGFLAQLPQLKLQMEGDDDLRGERYDAAIAKYEQFLKGSPSKEEAAAVMYNMSLAHARAGRFDAARKVIDEVVAVNPNDSNAQQLKKLLYENEEKMALNQAIQKMNAGAEALKQGKAEEALRIYQTTMTTAPAAAHRDLWLGIARSHKALNHEAEMLEAYKKTIELSKEKVPVAQELATDLFSKDKPAEAIQALTDTYKLAGQPPDEGLFAMAQIYAKKTATKKYAQALFEEVLKHNPEHAEANYELGMIYNYDLNDSAKAKALLTKYTQIGKDEGRVGNARAVLVSIEKTAPATKTPAKKK